MARALRSLGAHLRERDRFWLDPLRACRRQGQTMMAYNTSIRDYVNDCALERHAQPYSEMRPREWIHSCVVQRSRTRRDSAIHRCAQIACRSFPPRFRMRRPPRCRTIPSGPTSRRPCNTARLNAAVTVPAQRCQACHHLANRSASQSRQAGTSVSSTFRPRMSAPMLSATRAEDALIESRRRCA